ncbi:MAG: hypothetical protein Q9194_003007 [Teloschistes cf. exilis]
MATRKELSKIRLGFLRKAVKKGIVSYEAAMRANDVHLKYKGTEPTSSASEASDDDDEDEGNKGNALLQTLRDGNYMDDEDLADCGENGALSVLLRRYQVAPTPLPIDEDSAREHLRRNRDGVVMGRNFAISARPCHSTDHLEIQASMEGLQDSEDAWNWRVVKDAEWLHDIRNEIRPWDTKNWYQWMDDNIQAARDIIAQDEDIEAANEIEEKSDKEKDETKKSSKKKKVEDKESKDKESKQAEGKNDEGPEKKDEEKMTGGMDGAVDTDEESKSGDQQAENDNNDDANDGKKLHGDAAPEAKVEDGKAGDAKAKVKVEHRKAGDAKAKGEVGQGKIGPGTLNRYKYTPL